MARILVIDNYDSFVYNLVQYLGQLGAEPLVYRNDAIDVPTARALRAGRAAHLARSGPARGAGVSSRLDRRVRGARSRCSASASATSASVRSSAAGRAATR